MRTKLPVRPAPWVVGTINDSASLTKAPRIHHKQTDFLEIRLDGFNTQRDLVEKTIRKIALPIIITARHPKEGAIHSLNTSQRKELYRHFFSYASFFDIELRSAAILADIRKTGKELGVNCILSYHNFRTTPPFSKIDAMAKEAATLGADVFKIATIVKTPVHLADLQSLILNAPKGLKISAMGMGGYGKISRLLLGKTGSVFNYGYITRAQVAGQWPVAVLRERLDELAED